MKRLLAVLFATALLGTAGTALAQVPNTGAPPIIHSELSNGWVGDEGSQAAGSLPYCYDRDGEWIDTSDNSFPPNWGGVAGSEDRDPSCDWLAESNGLPQDSSLPRGSVVNGEWRNDICLNRLNPCYVGASKLLTRLDLGTEVGGQPVRTNNLLVPGLGQLWAWSGEFADLNSDGWIEDHWPAARNEIGLRNDCANTIHNPIISSPPPFGPADPNGLGTPQGVNTGVSIRCHQITPTDGDEWVGDNNDRVVFYVTPGDFNENADFVNGFFENDTAQPDCNAQARAVEGYETGQYFCPTSNFDYVIIDNGVLETTVIETIANPVPGTTRSEERGAGSLADVDLYVSVNPTLETLYEETVVQNVVAIGCDVDWPVLAGACPVLLQRVLQIEHDVEDLKALPVPFDPPCATPPCSLTDAQQFLDNTLAPDPTTGAVDNLFWPNWGNDAGTAPTETPTGVDYTDVGGHLYFDQRLIALTTSFYGPIAGQDTSFGNGGVFWDGTVGAGFGIGGDYSAVLQTEVHAQVGIWEDLGDQDGVIGDWTEDSNNQDHCLDVWDCGNDNDPNEYDVVSSDGEFTPVCGTDATDAVNAPGSYYATLTPSSNWVGVYLITDRNVAGGNVDPLIDDGRSTPFNPYDDAALDLLGLDTNNDPSRLNLYNGETTPIVLHMICDTGFYASYERLIFLVPNLTYDITLTGSVTAAVGTGSETRSDTDVYEGLLGP